MNIQPIRADGKHANACAIDSKHTNDCTTDSERISSLPQFSFQAGTTIMSQAHGHRYGSVIPQPFGFSYNPSEFLTGKLYRQSYINSDALPEFLENKRDTKIEMIALCRCPIGSGLTAASNPFNKGKREYHEYTVVNLGYHGRSAKKPKGLFAQETERLAELVVIEFSKNRKPTREAPMVGIVSVTVLLIPLKYYYEDLDSSYARYAKKVGGAMEVRTCTTLDDGMKLGNVMFMASALASKEYDLVDHNCRHFARSLVSSTIAKRSILEEDHAYGREVREWLKKNLTGKGQCVNCIASGSLVSAVASKILLLSMVSVTDSGITIAFNIAQTLGSYETFIDLCKAALAQNRAINVAPKLRNACDFL